MKILNIPRGSYVLKSSEITPEITELILSTLEYDIGFLKWLGKMSEREGKFIRLNIHGGTLEDYGYNFTDYFEMGNLRCCLNSTPIHFKEILKYIKEPPKCLRSL